MAVLDLFSTNNYLKNMYFCYHFKKSYVPPLLLEIYCNSMVVDS